MHTSSEATECKSILLELDRAFVEFPASFPLDKVILKGGDLEAILINFTSLFKPSYQNMPILQTNAF